MLWRIGGCLVMAVGCAACIGGGAVQAQQGAQPSEERPAADIPEGQPSATEEAIDFNKARLLLKKLRDGEKLSPEEQAYLDRARQLRRRQGGREGAKRPVGGKSSLELIPLTDLPAEANYHGESGGLYGEGRNEPPPAHQQAAQREAEKIVPLDAEGRPDPAGKIGLISSGMSNVTQEFQQFMRLAAADAEKSPRVVIVDGAQGGQEASDWAHPDQRYRQERPDPWEVLDARLKQAGLSPLQVQVLWLKQARRNPAKLGAFPKHAEIMKEDLQVVLAEMKRRFPNLRIAYLSSRIYAGYAGSPLNPEPYAYESAFTMRWLVRDQIAGQPPLNYDSARGPVKAPLLLWGPYLWANGEQGRKGDDLVWLREDLASDGTHPSQSGRRKVAELLLKFLKTDPTARGWFLKSAK